MNARTQKRQKSAIAFTIVSIGLSLFAARAIVAARGPYSTTIDGTQIRTYKAGKLQAIMTLSEPGFSPQFDKINRVSASDSQLVISGRAMVGKSVNGTPILEDREVTFDMATGQRLSSRTLSHSQDEK
jgi:hypothetical protein